MPFPIFPKVKFQWNEPAEFVASRDRKNKANEKWWLQPLCLVVFVAVMMLMQYFRLHHPVPGKHPPSLQVSLPLIILMGLFIWYGVPWINRRCPSQVWLRSRSITVSRGQQIRRFDYKLLRGYAWSLKEDIFVLILHRNNGKESAIGVPDAATMQSADALLREFGLNRLA